MIRTTKHSNKFANTNKLNNYNQFITEMRRLFIDILLHELAALHFWQYYPKFFIYHLSTPL